MNADFDKAASTYDKDFTHTPIGKLQRQRVWNYMKKVKAKWSFKNVLELNCGTGEDAQFLTNLGCDVTATDISESMLEVAKAKSEEKKLNISFQKLDIAEPALKNPMKYDLVFSNFGGLNCIDSQKLQSLGTWLSKHLTDQGHVILVIMPSKNLIDNLYRRAKGQQKLATIRATEKKLEVNVEGNLVTSYYFDTQDIVNAFDDFKVHRIQSIGYIPSFLNKSNLLYFLLLLDKIFYSLNFSPDRSDHYLIHLQKNR